PGPRQRWIPRSAMGSTWLDSSQGILSSLSAQNESKTSHPFSEIAWGFLLRSDFPVEPGAGVVPVAVGGGKGNAQRFGGLVHGQAGEVAELDQRGLDAVLPGEFIQGLVQGQEVVGRPGRRRLGEVQVEPLPVAATTEGLLAAGLLDQDAAHGLGRGREEV